MFLIDDIKNAAIALAIGLATGGVAGYYTKAQFDKAAVVTQVVQAQKQTAQNAIASAKKSQEIDKQVQASDTSIDAIQKAVAKHLKEKHRVVVEKQTAAVETSISENSRVTPDQPETEKKDDGQTQTVAQSQDFSADMCGELDVGTVRMLNAARANDASVDPASISDAASQAPSGIDEADLIQNDLDIVKQYHELAERHNALVDYVESVMKQQAK